MRKGFTLIELLAVIVLLGILGVVIIPKIGDSITNSKNKAYLVQVESIKKGVNDFLIDNDIVIPDNGTVTIKLGAVKQGGYLPVDIKNPITRKSFSNESTITITSNGNSYSIVLNLFDVENYNDTVDPNAPILVLNGNYVEYVEVNDVYTDPGVSTYMPTGELVDLNDNSVQMSSQIFLIGNQKVEKTRVDTSLKSTYEIVYTLSYDGGTYSATRTVIVRDTTAPVITVPDETKLHVSEVASFNIMSGVVVSDNYDTLSGNDITVTSGLANLKGKYVVTYSVSDSSGNETSIRRVINVNNNWSEYYTGVEYIQSTGTQYIETDIVPNDTMGIYAKLSSQNTESDLIYFGSRATNDTRFWVGNEKNSIYYGWNTITELSNRPTANVNNINEIKINYLNDRTNYLGNLLIEANLGTLSSNNIYPISIFAGNSAGETDRAKSKIKLYKLKISEGAQVKYDFIPCYRNSDNEAGLYDLINNKFYTNSGTGKFKVKELKESIDNYERLSYIQSTGEQYIITDIIPNNTMGIYAKLSSQNTINDVGFLGSKGSDDTRFWIGNLATNKLYYGWNTVTSLGNMSTFELNTIYEVKMNYLNSRNNYLDDVLNENISTTLSSDNNYSIAIFTLNKEGAISAYKSKMKLYELKISEGNKVTYDFVPCYRKVDEVAGLYDLVNNVFYENAGTGEFIKGELES